MKYKTKPFEIEAVQFTGENWAEIATFVGSRAAGYNTSVTIPNFDHVEAYWPSGTYDPVIVAVVWDYLHETWVGVRVGDHIIRGSKGEFYPCDPEVFESKYELIIERTVVYRGTTLTAYSDGSIEFHGVINAA